jgi:hypothetical protein
VVVCREGTGGFVICLESLLFWVVVVVAVGFEEEGGGFPTSDFCEGDLRGRGFSDFSEGDFRGGERKEGGAVAVVGGDVGKCVDGESAGVERDVEGIAGGAVGEGADILVEDKAPSES